MKSSSPSRSLEGNNSIASSVKKTVTASSSYTLEEEKKMLERAKRFGLPCKSEKTSISDDVLKARAIRFGPVNTEVKF